jgi:hypothetical protein
VVHHTDAAPIEDGWPPRWTGGRQRGLAALVVGAVGLGVTILAWRQVHAPTSAIDPNDRVVVVSPPAEAVLVADTRTPETAARLADTVAVAEASAALAQPESAPPSTRGSRSAGRGGGARGLSRGSQAARPARPAPVASEVAPATESSGSAASAAQAMADVMREHEFDPAQAKAALEEAGHEAAACKSEETSAHFARFAITFAPTGKVSSVEIEGGPLIGTNVGGCMLDAFRAAQVPAFSGMPVTVHKNLAF